VPRVPTFHDFDLVDVTLGPRREIRLQLRDGLGGTSCVVRFAAIDDFARVEAFFRRLQRTHPDAYLARVDDVRAEAGAFVVTLDPGGAVRIVTAKPPTITPVGTA